MIFIYSENNANAEKIAKAVEEGIQIGGGMEVKQTKNPTEASEEDYLVLCIAKKTLGNQLPDTATIKAKKIYLAGAGFSLREVEAIAKQLTEKGFTVQNSICLRRKALLAGVVEEPLREEELARAKAFGERITLALTGQRARQKNEKNRIRNYA